MLPEPWLPLKKGQTLVNSDRNGNRPHRDPGDQAVVLTLRKRYSVARTRGGRMQSPDNRENSGAAGPSDLDAAGESTPLDPHAVIDPWQDARPSTRRARTQPSLSHRLSYDHASGVIMLPEDSEWLEDDEDSDEDDYGTEHGLDQSITESLSSDIAVAPATSTSPGQPASRLSRYRTYFHHPERRRQSVPGAFPTR